MKCAVLAGLMIAICMIPLDAREKTTVDKSNPSKTATAEAGKQPSARRVFELRTYITNEGKLNDLHKRFHDHTCSLLKKHGAELVGFWTPLDEKDGKGEKLVYLVAFPSREAAKKTWDSFGADPEWRKAYAESHKDGVLVKKVESVFLEPTEYSEMK